MSTKQGVQGHCIIIQTLIATQRWLVMYLHSSALVNQGKRALSTATAAFRHLSGKAPSEAMFTIREQEILELLSSFVRVLGRLLEVEESI